MKTQEDKMTANENDDLQAHYDFDYAKAKPNRFAERIHIDGGFAKHAADNCKSETDTCVSVV